MLPLPLLAVVALTCDDLNSPTQGHAQLGWCGGWCWPNCIRNPVALGETTNWRLAMKTEAGQKWLKGITVACGYYPSFLPTCPPKHSCYHFSRKGEKRRWDNKLQSSNCNQSRMKRVEKSKAAYKAQLKSSCQLKSIVIVFQNNGKRNHKWEQTGKKEAQQYICGVSV